MNLKSAATTVASVFHPCRSEGSDVLGRLWTQSNAISSSRTRSTNCSQAVPLSLPSFTIWGGTCKRKGVFLMRRNPVKGSLLLTRAAFPYRSRYHAVIHDIIGGNQSAATTWLGSELTGVLS